MRVALILDGPDQDIADIVGMAVSGSLLVKYEVEMPDAFPGLPELRKTEKKATPTLAVGARVRMHKYESRYKIAVGTYGQITEVVMDGPVKKAYLVRWENGEESRVGGNNVRVAS